jgi:hypothetical protein
VTNSVPQWLDLLWYDPTVTPQAPSSLPTLRHFDDIGIVSARSGWSGDESLIVFKCGPPAGHHAVDSYSLMIGPGHAHPDGNHFVIFGCGEWLLRDDGYAWKDTGQHNTLLVDGKGQAGEGSLWLNAALNSSAIQVHPRVLAARSVESLDETSGDAAALYPAAAGLKRYLRPSVFSQARYSPGRRPHRNRHPAPIGAPLPFRATVPEDRRGLFFARGPNTSLRIELFTRDGVTTTAGDMNRRAKDGRPLPLHTVRMQANRSLWRNVVAFSWAPNGVDPIHLTAERTGHEWIFRAAARTVKLAL